MNTDDERRYAEYAREVNRLVDADRGLEAIIGNRTIASEFEREVASKLDLAKGLEAILKTETSVPIGMLKDGKLLKNCKEAIRALRRDAVEGAQLSQVDFSNQTLRRLVLRDVLLERANFTGAELVHTRFEQCRLQGAVFRRANMVEGSVSGGTFDSVDASYAHLESATLSWLDAKEVNFYEAHLSSAKLMSTHLNRTIFDSCDLSHSKISRVKFEDSSFEGANAMRANLSNCSFNSCSMSSVRLENAIVTDVVFSASLVKANFSRTRLRGVSFADCDMRSAKFRLASLEDVPDFRGANLSDVDLSTLTGAGLDSWRRTPEFFLGYLSKVRFTERTRWPSMRIAELVMADAVQVAPGVFERQATPPPEPPPSAVSRFKSA